MESLARDCHKLSKHQAASTQKAAAAVDSAIRELEAARGAATAGAGLQQARRQVERAQRTVGEQLKELYTNVAKYSKHVDKAFKLDLGYVAESRAFEDKREELAQSILQHLLREGDFETARAFAREAQLVLPEQTLRQFEDMYAMVAAIRGPTHELGAALAWSVEHRAELEAAGIALEFALHRLRFLQLVEGGQTIDALRYAREWFPRFGPAAAAAGGQGGSEAPAGQLEEIERLMGVVIYARRLEASPYAGQFAPQRWEDGARAFASAFCRLLGLAAESPLSVTIDAGARALPVVCKVSGLLRDKRVEWSQQNELPTEVPLPDSMRFHSVFACPVSKEQASPDNPPMMMPCGHVICRASLEKLARGIRPGASATGRFKCPYCPGMSGLLDAKPVHF
ncbi:hypothetical protein H4R19_000373 [Coemansia spiralis]|nr:hypothetical protein H4R19_000373 [Coemansia spiralis]